MTFAWAFLIDFYRLRVYGRQVPGYRALIYTVFGYAVAATGQSQLLFLNGMAVLCLFMFFGAYDNLWDWRLHGERNSTREAMDRYGLSLPMAMTLAWAPWGIILPLLLFVERALHVAEVSQQIFWLMTALGLAYITPSSRLKERAGGFFIAPIWACLLFLQGYSLSNASVWWAPVMILCALVFCLQCHAELLHRLDDRASVSSPVDGRLLQWLRWLSKLSLSGSLLAAAFNPVFLNTALWSLVRLQAVKRLRPEGLTQARRDVWRPVWSLYEFGIYGMLGLWHSLGL